MILPGRASLCRPIVALPPMPRAPPDAPVPGSFPDQARGEPAPSSASLPRLVTTKCCGAIADQHNLPYGGVAGQRKNLGVTSDFSVDVGAHLRRRTLTNRVFSATALEKQRFRGRGQTRPHTDRPEQRHTGSCVYSPGTCVRSAAAAAREHFLAAFLPLALNATGRICYERRGGPPPQLRVLAAEQERMREQSCGQNDPCFW